MRLAIGKLPTALAFGTSWKSVSSALKPIPGSIGSWPRPVSKTAKTAPKSRVKMTRSHIDGLSKGIPCMTLGHPHIFSHEFRASAVSASIKSKGERGTEFAHFLGGQGHFRHGNPHQPITVRRQGNAICQEMVA